MKRLMSVALVMAFLAFPGSSPGADCSQAYALMEDSRNSEEQLVDLEKKYPDCGEISVCLGDFYYDREIWKAAFEHYRKAFKVLGPTDKLKSRLSELEGRLPVAVADADDLGKLRGLAGMKKLPPLVLHIQFDTNSAEIKPSSKKLLDNFAMMLTTTFAGRKFIIEGHTDNVGRYEPNLKLSRNRANSVRDYLVRRHGIDPDRLEAEGYAYKKPIDTNLTPEGRRNNRRVQFAGQ
ncbi:MAG: OmpA family protein [Deltaproteobacteria bacterium]|nr:OmpA family protein [Deltaproteobacteria bacterium]